MDVYSNYQRFPSAGFQPETAGHGAEGMGKTSLVDGSPDTLWHFPTPEAVKQQMLAEVSECDNARAWEEAAEAMRTYHDELIGRWQKEIDTLLVYAGLFSAVLTAFNVQSYQLLQPPTSDPTLAVLQQISAQLNSFSITPPFANSTQPARSLDDIQPQFRAPPSAVWINTLWFSSLVCSLASASISLMVKQWLQEQTIGISGTSRESARLRQHRLNGLLKWRVGTIVVLLPILIQFALALFLVGLIILLWTLHSTVAAVTSTLIGLLSIFLIVATLLPAFRWDCCYRSPHALAIYMAIRTVRSTTKIFVERSLSWFYLWLLHHGTTSVTGWLRSLLMSWTRKEAMPTWRGRDQVNISKSLATLDRDIITMAYTTTLSTRHIDNLPLAFPDLSLSELGECFRKIHAAWERQWGTDTYRHSETVQFNSLPRPLLYALRRMLSVAHADRDEDWERVTVVLLRYLHPLVRPATRKEDVELSLEILCQFVLDISLPSRVAFNTATEFIILWDAYEKHGQWPRSFLQVMTMSERMIRNWDALKQHTFRALELWLAAVHNVIGCAEASLTPDGPVPPDQTERICYKARDILMFVRDRLHTQRWAGLDADITQGWEVRRPGITSSDILLCALPFWLEEHVAAPLIAVCQTPRGRAVVPEGLVEALEDAWAGARAAHASPGAATSQGNAARGVLPEAAAMDTLMGTLAELKAAIRGEAVPHRGCSVDSAAPKDSVRE